MPGFPKNRERGDRQLLHSMWLLNFGQPRQPQRCSHPCRNPRKLDSCAGPSIFRTCLTDAEPRRQFPRLPFPETLFRNGVDTNEGGFLPELLGSKRHGFTIDLALPQLGKS